jgi:homoserine kinase
VILVAVPQFDVETTASRETQPRNRARQMVNVAERVIAILVALGKKRKNRSRTIILARIAIPRQLADSR